MRLLLSSAVLHLAVFKHKNTSCVCAWGCVYALLLCHAILSACYHLSGLIGTPCHTTIWYQNVEMWIRRDALSEIYCTRIPDKAIEQLSCTWTARLFYHCLSVRVKNVLKCGYMVVLMNLISRIVVFTSFLLLPLYSISLTRTYIMPQIFPSSYIKPTRFAQPPPLKNSHYYWSLQAKRTKKVPEIHRAAMEMRPLS